MAGPAFLYGPKRSEADDDVPIWFRERPSVRDRISLRSFPENAQITGSFNGVQVITAGFEEATRSPCPWGTHWTSPFPNGRTAGGPTPSRTTRSSGMTGGKWNGRRRETGKLRTGNSPGASASGRSHPPLLLRREKKARGKKDGLRAGRRIRLGVCGKVIRGPRRGQARAARPRSSSCRTVSPDRHQLPVTCDFRRSPSDSSVCSLRCCSPPLDAAPVITISSFVIASGATVLAS